MSREFKTMDGNTAAHVAYAFTECCRDIPDSPSSVMAEETDKWAAHGKRTCSDAPVKVVEMQLKPSRRRGTLALWRPAPLPPHTRPHRVCC